MGRLFFQGSAEVIELVEELGERRFQKGKPLQRTRLGNRAVAQRQRDRRVAALVWGGP